MFYQALYWLHCSEVYKLKWRLSKSLSWLTVRAYIFRKLRTFDWDISVTTYTKTPGTVMDTSWCRKFCLQHLLTHLWFKYLLHWQNKRVNKLAFLVFIFFKQTMIYFYLKQELATGFSKESGSKYFWLFSPYGLSSAICTRSWKQKIWTGMYFNKILFIKISGRYLTKYLHPEHIKNLLLNNKKTNNLI